LKNRQGGKRNRRERDKAEKKDMGYKRRSKKEESVRKIPG
jgi:hypothetical protein